MLTNVLYPIDSIRLRVPCVLWILFAVIRSRFLVSRYFAASAMVFAGTGMSASSSTMAFPLAYLIAFFIDPPFPILFVSSRHFAMFCLASFVIAFSVGLWCRSVTSMSS